MRDDLEKLAQDYRQLSDFIEKIDKLIKEKPDDIEISIGDTISIRIYATIDTGCVDNTSLINETLFLLKRCMEEQLVERRKSIKSALKE